MQEFFWKYASCDPFYLQQASPKTRTFFFLTGIVLFSLTICSLVSFTYVGYVLYQNLLEAAIIGITFSYLMFNFYRISLLTFSWHGHKKERIVKSKILSITIKLLFMSLLVFFFLCAFEMFIFRETLSDFISKTNSTDGIFTRLEFLFKKLPSSQFITFILCLLFTWPLLVRFFLKSYSSDYDLVKAKHEKEIIESHYQTFLFNYRNTLAKVSEGKSQDIIYDMMVDPPFDVRLKPKKFSTVGDEALFQFLEKKS